MDDNGNTIDALTKARRERRRLLIGGGVAGSLMLTLPSRRLLASTKKKKSHGSIWCSFCNAKKKGTTLSNTPIVTNNCGDSPGTWLNYINDNNPNDCPVGWTTFKFEQYFSRPVGYDLYISSTSGGTGVRSNSAQPTFLQCLQNKVYYLDT